MKHLDKWAKGRSVGLVIMAQQLAVGAEACFKFLKWVKSGDRIEAFSSLPKVKDWVKLYRNHRQIQRCLLEKMRMFGKNGKLLAEMAEMTFLRTRTLGKAIETMRDDFRRMRPFEQRRFISKQTKEMSWLYSLHRADIESDIKRNVDKELETKLREALNEPEIKFFFKVWIPCWFLYGDYPPRLLRRARLGDVKAMERLLRLDPSVEYDAKIEEYLHQARAKGKKKTVTRLTDAMQRGPKAKITLKKVKYSFGGLISSISIFMEHRLTEPEIRELFDAVAHDVNKEDYDQDLPDSPEAFQKAIRRERAFWMPALLPDKK